MNPETETKIVIALNQQYKQMLIQNKLLDQIRVAANRIFTLMFLVVLVQVIVAFFSALR